MEDAYTYIYRVRYADTDQMGVVYHARYLEWFEAARTEMLREAGLPYRELEKAGFSLPVVEAHCIYKKPVLYDDLIEIETCKGPLSRLRLELYYRVRRQGEDTLLAEGRTNHVFVGHDGRPVRVAPAYQQIFESL